MARKGTRKYRCEECKTESFHHWIERNRAARMRCPACGSARLELVAAEAKKDAADLNAIRVSRGTPSTTLPPSSSRKKVT